MTAREGAVLRGKVAGSGHARTCSAVDILKATQQRAEPYCADADWGLGVY